MNADLDNKLISMCKGTAKNIESILKLDSQFLKRHKLMDYSLLLAIESQKVGIQVCEKDNVDFEPSLNRAESVYTVQEDEDDYDLPLLNEHYQNSLTRNIYTNQVQGKCVKNRDSRPNSDTQPDSGLAQ